MSDELAGLLVDLTLFFDLSDESAVEPAVASKQLELIVFHLRRLPSEERNALSEFVSRQMLERKGSGAPIKEINALKAIRKELSSRGSTV
jgi:hypothetical protein